MKHACLYLSLFFGFALLASDSSVADKLPRKTYLSSEKLELSDTKLIWLADNWLYHTGDDTSWANPDYDDSDWESVHPTLNLRARYPKDGWRGIGWFRLHLKVDSTLQNKPLGMWLRHLGASEVFLDGKLIFKLGKVGKNAQEEKRFYPQYPRTVIFSRGKNHIIAVRYSNHAQNEYMRKISGMGFSVNIGHIDDAIAVKQGWSLRHKTNMFLLITSSLFLALFHIILFFKNPKQKLNLYFTLLSVAFASHALFNFQDHFTSNPDLFVLINQLKGLTSVVLVIFQLLTIYKLFYPKLPKLFFLFSGFGIIVLLLLATASSKLHVFNTWFMILGFGEAVRVGVMHGLKRRNGYWIIFIGLVILFISMVYQMLINFQVVRPLGGIFIVYIYGFLTFLISLSIFLAQQFAQISRKLGRS